MGQFILLTLIVCGVIVYTSFSWGFVAYKFYGWFILPTFPELPMFTITQFVGFVLFVSVMTHKEKPSLKKELIDESGMILNVIFTPWIVFLMGLFIHTFF